MSYYLADINGYLGEAGSISGIAAFEAWAARRGSAAISAFCETGVAEDPEALAKDLDEVVASDAIVEDVRQAVLTAARKAEELLILSDGVGGDEETQEKSLFDAGTATHQGLLVCLWLDDEAATRLALPAAVYGAEPAEDLHITLAYCDDVDELGDVAIAKVIAELSTLRHAPLVGKTTETDRFPASEQSDGRDVVYAKPVIAELAAFRETVVAALAKAGVTPRGDFAWLPHITLAYVEPTDIEPITIEPVELEFDAITIKVGEKRTALPLVEPEPDPPAEEDDLSNPDDDKTKGHEDQPRDEHGRWGSGNGPTHEAFTDVEDAASAYVFGIGGTGAYGLASALRSGGTLSPTQESVVKLLDDAMKPLDASQARMVYRGLEGAFAESLEAGMTFTDKAFVSVSKRYESAEEFGTVVMHITLPAGTKGLDVNKTFASARQAHHKEIILPRGLKFKVTEAEIFEGVGRIDAVVVPHE